MALPIASDGFPSEGLSKERSSTGQRRRAGGRTSRGDGSGSGSKPRSSSVGKYAGLRKERSAGKMNSTSDHGDDSALKSDDDTHPMTSSDSSDSGSGGALYSTQAFSNAVMAVRKKDDEEKKARGKSPGKYYREKSPGKYTSTRRRGRSPGQMNRSQSPGTRRASSQSPGAQSRRRGAASKSPGKYRSKPQRRGRSPGHLGDGRSKSPGSRSSAKSPGKYNSRGKSPGHFRRVSPGKYQPRVAAEIVRRSRSKATEQMSLLLSDGPPKCGRSLMAGSRSGSRKSLMLGASQSEHSTSGRSVGGVRKSAASRRGGDQGDDTNLSRSDHQPQLSRSDHQPRRSRAHPAVERKESLEAGVSSSDRRAPRSRVVRRAKSEEFVFSPSDLKHDDSEYAEAGPSHHPRRSGLKREGSSSNRSSAGWSTLVARKDAAAQQPSSTIVEPRTARANRRRPKSVEPEFSRCDDFDTSKSAFDASAFEVDPFAAASGEDIVPLSGGPGDDTDDLDGSFAMDPFLDTDSVDVEFNDKPEEDQFKPKRRSGATNGRRGSGDHKSKGRSSSRDDRLQPRAPRRANSCDMLPAGASTGPRKAPMRTRSGDKLGNKLNYFENLSGQNDQPFSFGF